MMSPPPSHSRHNTYMSDNDGLGSLRRHEKYYLNGGDLFVLVEQDLFRVHRYFFERESPYFRQRLAGGPSPGDQEPIGTADNNAIIFKDIRSCDFARFLWVFYNPKYSLYKATIDDWESILHLADEWSFGEVKELTVRELEKLEMSDIDRIVLYQNYNVDRGLLIPRYAALADRKEPISIEEGLRLGLETALTLARAREMARNPPEKGGSRNSSPAGLREEEMRGIIEQLFEAIPNSTSGGSGMLSSPYVNGMGSSASGNSAFSAGAFASPPSFSPTRPARSSQSSFQERPPAPTQPKTPPRTPRRQSSMRSPPPPVPPMLSTFNWVPQPSPMPPVLTQPPKTPESPQNLKSLQGNLSQPPETPASATLSQGRAETGRPSQSPTSSLPPKSPERRRKEESDGPDSGLAAEGEAEDVDDAVAGGVFDDCTGTQNENDSSALYNVDSHEGEYASPDDGDAQGASAEEEIMGSQELEDPEGTTDWGGDQPSPAEESQQTAPEEPEPFQEEQTAQDVDTVLGGHIVPPETPVVDPSDGGHIVIESATNTPTGDGGSADENTFDAGETEGGEGETEEDSTLKEEENEEWDFNASEEAKVRSNNPFEAAFGDSDEP